MAKNNYCRRKDCNQTSTNHLTKFGCVCDDCIKDFEIKKGSMLLTTTEFEKEFLNFLKENSVSNRQINVKDFLLQIKEV